MSNSMVCLYLQDRKIQTPPPFHHDIVEAPPRLLKLLIEIIGFTLSKPLLEARADSRHKIWHWNNNWTIHVIKQGSSQVQNDLSNLLTFVKSYQRPQYWHQHSSTFQEEGFYQFLSKLPKAAMDIGKAFVEETFKPISICWYILVTNFGMATNFFDWIEKHVQISINFLILFPSTCKPTLKVFISRSNVASFIYKPCTCRKSIISNHNT